TEALDFLDDVLQALLQVAQTAGGRRVVGGGGGGGPGAEGREGPEGPGGPPPPHAGGGAGPGGVPPGGGGQSPFTENTETGIGGIAHGTGPGSEGNDSGGPLGRESGRAGGVADAQRRPGGLEQRRFGRLADDPDQRPGVAGGVAAAECQRQLVAGQFAL